jgi:hypothetical protein
MKRLRGRLGMARAGGVVGQFISSQLRWEGRTFEIILRNRMKPEIKINFPKLRPISMLHFETQVDSRFVVARARIKQRIVKFVRDCLNR